MIRASRHVTMLAAALLIAAATFPSAGLASNPADYADDLRFREEFGLTTEITAVSAIVASAEAEAAFGVSLTAEEGLTSATVSPRRSTRGNNRRWEFTATPATARAPPSSDNPDASAALPMKCRLSMSWPVERRARLAQRVGVAGLAQLPEQRVVEPGAGATRVHERAVHVVGELKGAEPVA